MIQKIKQHKFPYKLSTFYQIFTILLFFPSMKLVPVPIWEIIVTQRLVSVFALPIPLERNVLDVHLIPGATASPLVVR